MRKAHTKFSIKWKYAFIYNKSITLYSVAEHFLILLKYETICTWPNLCFHKISFSWYEISAKGSFCITSRMVSSSFCRLIGVSCELITNMGWNKFDCPIKMEQSFTILHALCATHVIQHTSKCVLLSLVAKKWANSSNSYSWGCTTGKANRSNSISRQAVSFSSGLDPVTIGNPVSQTTSKQWFLTMIII